MRLDFTADLEFAHEALLVQLFPLTQALAGQRRAETGLQNERVEGLGEIVVRA